MASDPKDAAPIRTTQDAIKAARRRLDEAQAHYLLGVVTQITPR